MNLTEKGIYIRDTAESDLPQIFSLGEKDVLFAGLSSAWNPDNLLSVFASEKPVCITALRSKKVIGFIIGSVAGGESTISWIMVKSTLRRAGIGSELLKLFTESSKKNGSEKFLTAALPYNHDSLKFFEKNGFSQTVKFVELTREI